MELQFRFVEETAVSVFLTDNSPNLRSNLKSTSGFLLDAQWKKRYTFINVNGKEVHHEQNRIWSSRLGKL